MKTLKFKLLDQSNYAEIFSVAGFSSFYETVNALIINNLIRTHAVYHVSNENLTYNFNYAPINAFLIQLTLEIVDNYKKTNPNFQNITNSFLIEQYLDNLKANDLQNFYADLFLEIKEFNEWLVNNKLNIRFNEAATRLFDFYNEKGSQKTLIYDVSLLIAKSLYKPFYTTNNIFAEETDYNNVINLLKQPKVAKKQVTEEKLVEDNVLDDNYDPTQGGKYNDRR